MVVVGPRVEIVKDRVPLWGRACQPVCNHDPYPVGNSGRRDIVEQGIVVDDEYVREFGKYLAAVTQNTWAKGYTNSHVKHKLVSSAYKSWFNRQDSQVRETLNSRCNQTEVAPTWICQAITKAGFSKDLPIFTGRFKYDFNSKELG